MFDNLEDLKAHLTVKQTFKCIVVDKKQLSSARQKYSSIILKEKAVTPIRDMPDRDDVKMILLKADADLSLLEPSTEICESSLILGYSSLSWNQILREALPEDIEVPSSFETIGHIAHFNLSDTQQKFKKIIGEVILDKINSIKTVVAKTGNIENTFRVLPMEIIAGEDNYETVVKEESCVYHLDFSKVYWNSRLSREHGRIAQRVKGVVADVFAGIGPFVVPAAKRENITKIYANDLNPESFKWLQYNCGINKVTDKVESFNMDGREFIRKILSGGARPDYFIMNLPALAPEFCDAFKNIYSEGDHLPTLIIYSFAPKNGAEEFTKKRLENILGVKCEGTVELVRLVAPNKWMVCHEIQLPEEILCSQKKKLTE